MAIADVLAAARRGVRRLSPAEVAAAVDAGALLVDTRTDAHRRDQGEIPGALVIDRTVLEWRLDPTSATRIPEADEQRLIVVVCRHGFSSSLAAASLRSIGLNATDMDGGVQAWIDAGFAMNQGSVDVRP